MLRKGRDEERRDFDKVVPFGFSLLLVKGIMGRRFLLTFSPRAGDVACRALRLLFLLRVRGILYHRVWSHFGNEVMEWSGRLFCVQLDLRNRPSFSTFICSVFTDGLRRWWIPWGNEICGCKRVSRLLFSFAFLEI